MAAVGRRLPALLNTYSATAIRRMVDSRQLTLPPGTRKSAAIEALVDDAPRPASVARMVALLSPEQRALLALLILYPGEVALDYIRTAAVSAQLVQRDDPTSRHPYYFSYLNRPTAGDPDKVHSKLLVDLVAGLSSRGLALASSESGTTGTLELGLSDNVLIPGEVRPALIALLEPDLPVLAEAPAPLGAGDVRAVHRALFLLWSTVRSKPVGTTQAGWVRKNDARRLGQALGVADKTTSFDAEPDLPYLYFVRRLAERLGLLLAGEATLEAAGRDRLRDLLALSWPERTLRLIRTWIAIAAAELATEGVGGDWRGTRIIPEAQARPAIGRVLGLLAGLPDAWVRLDAFVRWIRLHHFGVLVLADDSPLAVHDLGTSLYRLPYGTLPGPDPWAIGDGAVIRRLVAEPLAWLGIVELAGAPGPAQAFRLAAPGRALLAALQDPAREADLLAPLGVATPGGRVVVQPNFQVLAVGDVPDETLFALSEVAELVRAEQVVEFKLTRNSVYAAQQAGWTPLAILDLLRGAGGGPLAQNVERSILDWAAAHERIVFRRDATLLAAGDSALLDRLAADPATAPLLGERLLPTLTLIRPGPAGLYATLGDLDRRLLAAGELPATSDFEQDSPIPSFQFDAAGRVTWKSPVPDLRVLGLLGSVARPGRDSILALDERTVRATAAARRWKPADVDGLLATLAAWHQGPLPETVTRQIKIWAGYQGRAQLRTVTLLTVDRPELLADLQADPGLAAVLLPLPATGTIALVQPPPPGAPVRRRGRPPADGATEAAAPSGLDLVRQALLAQGFTLDEGDPA